MHPYVAHKLIHERQAELIRRTEIHARLLPDSPSRTEARRRLALWLRGLADRIDGSAPEVGMPAPTS